MAAGPKLREYRRKRDFTKTSEPRGAGRKAGDRGSLVFVIQKHAASHLHYDLRLESGGVMKSWAVPKGPSLDPSVKRLAIEVEDHPMEYNDFEGTIPQGEYGGGTVMLWDRGTYEPDERREGEDADTAVRRGLRRGKLAFTLHGERLEGSFALVRTSRGDEGQKPQWLLIKHDDEDADPGSDITAEVQTSVATGRTMDEIAAGKGGGRTWHSNREPKSPPKGSGSGGAPARMPDLGLEPMLAQSAREVPSGRGWVYEPKYDGIRVLALATPDTAALVTRNGHDKAKQFPEVVEGLTALAGELGQPLVLDGEIVGVRGDAVLRFESLQSRMHLENRAQIDRLAEDQPAALMTFDLLLVGEEVLLQEPWEERRERLESVLEGRTSETVRLGEASRELEPLRARAGREGWEGLMAKKARSLYRPGKRSPDWLKLKMENRQEFVVGGWTEPRKSRKHLGAILLGYYDEAGDFVYAGHTGGGFTGESLSDMYARLKKLERKTPPFREKPKTNETAHWTTPRVVVEVKFNEWTKDGKLRQPTFVGVREDKDPKSVVREPDAGAPAPESGAGAKPKKRAGTSRRRGKSGSAAAIRRGKSGAGGDAVVRQIRRLREKKPYGGTLSLEGGQTLEVTNLQKVFFPTSKHTKGDLLEYYAAMAEHILPGMEGRPLVLKRFPNGIGKESFYQQSAPDEVPEGVRVEHVQLTEEPQPRLVGGSLATLLYTIQLGAISYDPWHSRVGHLESADYTILDLDPGPGATFRTVVEVARWVKEEMDRLGLHGALKTSGSSGLHVYLPLPPDTPLEAATLVAQIVATRVAQEHPDRATVRRMRRDRPKGTVYVDYLQNILGKTVAGVYAVRAKPGATVSTPLAWDELTDDLDLREFTIDTVPGRVRERGDLWADALRDPIDLSTLLGAAA